MRSKVVLFLAVTFVVAYGASALGVIIDTAINGYWLRQITFDWTMLFTTKHGITLLWLHSKPWWAVAAAVLSLVTTCVAALRMWLRN